jgi:hypothetical protein
MMMNVEQSVEWELAGESEVIRENLPSANLSITNPTWPNLGFNPVRRGRHLLSRALPANSSSSISWWLLGNTFWAESPDVVDGAGWKASVQHLQTGLSG